MPMVEHKFIVAAIDPGENTGIAIASFLQLTDNGPVLDTTTIETETIPDEEFEKRLPLILNREVQKFIVEIAAAQGNSTQSGRIGKVNFALEQQDKLGITLYISPGNWKPLARSHSWAVAEVVKGMFKTQHEKDAYCMLKWYEFLLRKQQKEDSK